MTDSPTQEPQTQRGSEDVYHLDIHLSSQHLSLSTGQRKDHGPYIPYIYMHTHTNIYIYIGLITRHVILVTH